MAEDHFQTNSEFEFENYFQSFALAKNPVFSWISQFGMIVHKLNESAKQNKNIMYIESPLLKILVCLTNKHL